MTRNTELASTRGHARNLCERVHHKASWHLHSAQDVKTQSAPQSAGIICSTHPGRCLLESRNRNGRLLPTKSYVSVQARECPALRIGAIDVPSSSGGSKANKRLSAASSVEKSPSIPVALINLLTCWQRDLFLTPFQTCIRSCSGSGSGLRGLFDPDILGHAEQPWPKRAIGSVFTGLPSHPPIL